MFSTNAVRFYGTGLQNIIEKIYFSQDFNHPRDLSKEKRTALL